MLVSFFLFLFSFMLEISINARTMTQRIRRQPPKCSYVWRLSRRPNETYRLAGGNDCSDLCVEWTIDGSAARQPGLVINSFINYQLKNKIICLWFSFADEWAQHLVCVSFALMMIAPGQKLLISRTYILIQSQVTANAALVIILIESIAFCQNTPK